MFTGEPGTRLEYAKHVKKLSAQAASAQCKRRLTNKNTVDGVRKAAEKWAKDGLPKLEAENKKGPGSKASDGNAAPEYIYDIFFARNMKDITDLFFMPSFPGYASGMHNNPDMTFTEGLKTKFRLTDYWTSSVGTPTHNWALERDWLRSLGFETHFDHGAKQVGLSCGVVASRVATWLRDTDADFMELDTTGAVSMDVLGEANTVLRANDVPLPEPWLESTKFLAPEELDHILYNWNGGHQWEILPGHVTDDAAQRFLSIDTRDQFRWKVARDVASARDNGMVPRRFSIVNTETSGSPGLHWVSVVYSIEKKEEDHGTQPGTEEVHTPAASSERRLNFTGSAPSSSLLSRSEDGQPDPTAPVDTHHAGTFLSQVILILYAAIAVIDSQNLARDQRLRADYKNRFLVS